MEACVSFTHPNRYGVTYDGVDDKPDTITEANGGETKGEAEAAERLPDVEIVHGVHTTAREAEAEVESTETEAESGGTQTEEAAHNDNGCTSACATETYDSSAP
jgi:hypothetical protein